jgi:predicted MPP superfamily phosphohydrolase
MATKQAEEKLEKILFIPDCHIPYHDAYAFDLMMTAGKAFKPDHVIICGDFADFYAVSSHDKNPERASQLEDEVHQVIEKLQEVKALGAKNNVFVSGNHEDRLTRYLMKKSPELYKTITVPKVLALKENGFHYVPYKSDYKIGKLYVTHDTGKAGVNAHKQALDAYHTNIVIGHTHRMGYVIMGDVTGDKNVGAMFGWLGDEKSIDYMYNINMKKDWTLGFGIGYLNKKTGVVYLTPVPIIKYTCVVEGKLYY